MFWWFSLVLIEIGDSSVEFGCEEQGGHEGALLSSLLNLNIRLLVRWSSYHKVNWQRNDRMLVLAIRSEEHFSVTWKQENFFRRQNIFNSRENSKIKKRQQSNENYILSWCQKNSIFLMSFLTCLLLSGLWRKSTNRKGMTLDYNHKIAVLRL